MFNVLGGMGFNLPYTKSVFSAYLFDWKIGPLGIFSIQTKSVTTTTWIFYLRCVTLPAVEIQMLPSIIKMNWKPYHVIWFAW